MKKSLIYSTTLAAALLASATGIIITNASATESSDIAAREVALTEATLTTKPALEVKDETIYAIANSDGTTGSLFVGNNLYTGANTLPVSLSIKYYLDGTEISAENLSGKTGHVKITYSYDSHAEFQGKKVPFLAATALTLDSAKFANLELENGKIISNRDNLIIVGYAMPGLNEDFDTDLFPDTFTLEADVTDFALKDSYTIFTNDIFKDLDTSKLSTIDDLISSMNQLSSGLNQIIVGSSDLSNGLSTALAGVKDLHAGSQTLAAGISEVSAGAATLSDGLNTLTTNNTALQAGATAIIAKTLAELNTAKLFPVTITADNYQTILSQEAIAAHPTLAEPRQLLDFATGVIGYTDGVASAAEGAAELKIGLNAISAKTPDLVSGLGSLVSGTEQLYTGSVQLNDGLNTFKTSGTDRLVSFANHDLANFTSDARAAVAAAKSYTHFQNESAESVKFIIKTPNLK